MNSLDARQVKDMFIYVADKVIENVPYLTEVDSKIGDGDHGIGMSIGLSNAKEALINLVPTSVNNVFATIGISMIKSMGGASGVIFGTMFSGGVKGLPQFTELDVVLLADIFRNSLTAIKERGKAKLGDKTMIDAFEPAVQSLIESASISIEMKEAFKLAEEAAKKGMEDTKNYSAKFGRAKSLGERSIGYQDAGATSVWIIFRSMSEWLENAI